MIKKILFLIFGLLLSALVAQSVGAADNIKITATPATTAKVGDIVKIHVDITNAPANGDKVQIKISEANSATFVIKDEFKAPAAGGSATRDYNWDTQKAGSDPGYHEIAVVIIDDKDVTLPANSKTVIPYTLTPADGSTGTGTTGSDNGFNIADLGTIIWPTNPSVDTPAKLITMIIKLLFAFIGVLAVIAVIYSGFMYMTAGNDQTKAENAKKNLTWAIIGIIIAALAYVLVGIIQAVITKVSP